VAGRHRQRPGRSRLLGGRHCRRGPPGGAYRAGRTAGGGRARPSAATALSISGPFGQHQIRVGPRRGRGPRASRPALVHVRSRSMILFGRGNCVLRFGAARRYPTVGWPVVPCGRGVGSGQDRDWLVCSRHDLGRED